MTRMADNIMRPIINLNGTSAKSLIDARIEARECVTRLMSAIGETRPHGRDYIGNHDAYERDLAIYRARFALLDTLYNDLGDESLDIQIRAREAD